MKYYSLLRFLSEPINQILDSETDYFFKEISPLKSESNTSDPISSIIIPTIQRDYAQGREENKTLLKEFLEKIFYHLDNKELLKLDFIYGSLNRDKSNVFYPLDGQQRLTTLYLLHLYIIKVETKDSVLKYEEYREILSKFSYETRDTSRRFFKKLVDLEFTKNPKDEVIESYWYNEHFALDPTVNAALNTLDIIHQIYTDKSYSDLLSSLEQEIIVFYVLLMDQFNLTDDLYIKLNARGKVLSSFENFKADIVGYIKNSEGFQSLRKTQNDLSMYHCDIISTKFDNQWTDLFWTEARKHLGQSEEIKTSKSVDTTFFRFIHRLLVNELFVNHKEQEELFDYFLNNEKNVSYNNYELYKPFITDEFLNDLEKILDFYARYNSIIEPIVCCFDKTSKWSIYKETFTMNIDRIFFYAVNQYVINLNDQEFNSNSFKHWIRIVLNLVSDPDVRSDEAYRSVMNVIRLIAIHSNNIYQSLSDGTLDDIINSINNIHKEQLVEEKLKAKLILEDASSWEALILKTEAHKLYEGSISFILKEGISAKDFEQRYNVSCLLFNNNEIVEVLNNQSYSLMRYVISKYTDFNALRAFNFLSTTQNWQTYLRRNTVVRESILDLILLNDINLIKNEISLQLSLDSKIDTPYLVEAVAHTRLYKENLLHYWMQKSNINKLTSKGEDNNKHIFAVRSRAWYDKVMLDGYRHQLISQMISHYNLDKDNKECNNSGFYWGDRIDFIKEIKDNLKVTFHFDVRNQLHIGLWGGLNPQVQDREYSKDGWKQIYSFDINEIKNQNDIQPFIDKIDLRLKSDPDCLILDIF
ncbi:DUF262 domain-containing protein [Myroides marinus]|uniref:GmrSD restriction endonuclease domain-containing protein n=1 Tax=Myroides marinus TaxID=703342 RepID=UPI0025752832|nr:DUF262 domain-containing protein [Myroides marinus]MDM1350947.1 DUF262 domain-containing protein [Myroides marinus]MDM1358154.1 DUF262 domain-containing protein [Myroides marinus]